MPKVIVDYDRENDVMYVLREDYQGKVTENIDSEKYPYVVKRLDPSSKICVGFTIAGFSQHFSKHVNDSQETLERLFQESLNRTNQSSDLPISC